jgi:hypothetical protein
VVTACRHETQLAHRIIVIALNEHRVVDRQMIAAPRQIVREYEKVASLPTRSRMTAAASSDG